MPTTAPAMHAHGHPTRVPPARVAPDGKMAGSLPRCGAPCKGWDVTEGKGRYGWIKPLMLIIFFAMLFGIPHNSPWFALIFVYMMAVALFVAVGAIWIALRDRIAAGDLSRTPATRALHPGEIEALLWFGQPERIVWRMPRGNVIDLATAARAAGGRPMVRTVRGPYRSRVRAHHHDRHDYIGQVEVLLLPGADRCLRPDNEAEVLLCGNVAVVLALNGTWHIDQARSLLR